MSDMRFIYIQEVDRDVLEVTEASPGPRGPVGTQPIFQRAGSLAVQQGASRYYVEHASAVQAIRASVGTSPVGAPVIVDVNLNGESLFGNPSDRLTIQPGQHTAVALPVGWAVLPGEYLTVDIDSVGTTAPGADLTVSVTLG